MEKHLNVPANTEELAELKSGDYVYLTGTIYTARDAAKYTAPFCFIDSMTSEDRFPFPIIPFNP